METIGSMEPLEKGPPRSGPDLESYPNAENTGQAPLQVPLEPLWTLVLCANQALRPRP